MSGKLNEYEHYKTKSNDSKVTEDVRIVAESDWKTATEELLNNGT